MKVSTKLFSKLTEPWQIGLLVVILFTTSLVDADDCGYSMGIACPPNLDPQSYVYGLEVQLNGGVGPANTSCPPVSHIYWDWGDSPLEEAFFPAYHEYPASREYTILVSATLTVVEIIACSGFNSPMADYPVSIKKNRVIPLKMGLFDFNGFEIMESDLTALPAFIVMLSPSNGDPVSDVSKGAFPAGKGSDGNQFEYTDDGIWQFNLKSRNYSASGEYMVTAVSGDETEYTFDPACVTSFQIN